MCLHGHVDTHGHLDTRASSVLTCFACLRVCVLAYAHALRTYVLACLACLLYSNVLRA